MSWRIVTRSLAVWKLTVPWCHHAQMSAWQGSAVPWRLLHTGHRCCWQAASQVGHTANDGGAMTPAIHWPPSIHRARPHGLELFAGRSPRTAGLWVLDSAWKPGFSLATSVLGASETSWRLRYRNSHVPLPFTISTHFTNDAHTVTAGASYLVWSLKLHALY